MHNDDSTSSGGDNYSQYDNGGSSLSDDSSGSSLTIEVDSIWKNLTRDEYLYFTNVGLKTRVMDFYGGKSFAYEPYEYYKTDHSGYTIYYVHYNIDFNEKLEVVHYERSSSWKSVLRVSDVGQTWCYGCQ